MRLRELAINYPIASSARCQLLIENNQTEIVGRRLVLRFARPPVNLDAVSDLAYDAHTHIYKIEALLDVM